MALFSGSFFSFQEILAGVKKQKMHIEDIKY